MASTEARRGRLPAVPGLVFPGRLSAPDLSKLWRALTHRAVVAVARETLAIGVLLGAVTLVYWPMLVGVGVYAESDTFTFFFPVFEVLHAAVRAGELPLWTPYVFGGFPLLAEGQIGAFYPPGLLAAYLPSATEGFLLLRVFHVTVATLGAFALARSLGTGATGGVVGGLAFGLGSFVVAQQHHANLLAAVVWLPLLLACVELGLARQGWVGQGLLGVAALILGVQALATHVQPLMLTGVLLAAYVVFRQGWMALGALRESGVRTGAGQAAMLLVDAIATVVFIGAIGALIAAVQILPLYELSQESWRAFGWSYQDAIEYSFPPVNLVTLLLPFFFRSPDGGQWSLWQIWESVLYVGVVPLVLALVAAVMVRRWAVTFFTLAALVTGVLSLGGYAPGGLYEAIWQLPGMNVQRAPGRFLMIAGLSLAMLAAFGAQWLVRSAGIVAGEGRRGRRLLVLHLVVLAILGGAIYSLIAWRAWLESNRSLAMQAAAQSYLSLSQDVLQQLKPVDVVLGLESSLDLANPKTQVPLLILGAFALLLVVWRELPRLRPLWQAALVLLVAADLAVFASDFHPLVDVAQLGDPGPAGRMLIDHAGPWRVLTRPDVEVPQPNELLPHKIVEASGYSPLQLERHRWYAQSVQTVDDVLLDLWSVRWIVETSRPEPMPSYRLVSFHPRRPLMIGGAGTPNGEISLTPEPSQATSVRIISALSGGEAIPDGEVVGEWLLSDSNGTRYVLPMRAGREIADWRPRAAGMHVAHRPIQQATTISLGEQAAERVLGYAELPLPRRLTVASLEYHHLNPVGRSLLYGVGLYDRVDDSTAQVTREDRYQVAYQDESTTVYENTRAYPRAFVVPEAVLVPDGVAAMARLRDGPLDPRSQVVIEGSPEAGTGPFPGTRPVDAAIAAEGTGVVDVRASAPGGGFLVLTDPYYPGWRAYVDGVESPIMRADYLFRTVELPPGTHDVRFVFLPFSLQRGALLTAVGVAIAVGAVLLGIGGALISRRSWRSGPLGRRAASAEGEAVV